MLTKPRASRALRKDAAALVLYLKLQHQRIDGFVVVGNPDSYRYFVANAARGTKLEFKILQNPLRPRKRGSNQA